MKRIISIFFIVLSFFLIFQNIYVSADTQAVITGNGVRLRKEAFVSNSNIIRELAMGSVITILSEEKISGAGCSNGWYQVKSGNDTGYVCSSYVSTNTNKSDGDIYLRPWTSPKKAIMGGAVFISNSYISKGQNTPYLKKFNVTSYKTYNHQYMANLQAPYSEAYLSYNSYKENGLLNLPLEFTIPVFNNMPEVTVLPGSTGNNNCQAEVNDSVFEEALNNEGFTEDYKCKLRILHNTYPNWTFKAMKTNLDFEASAIREQSSSSIQGKDIYLFKDANGNKVMTEKNWYKANIETVRYYLDPRNFLVPERILMFENLGYSDNYTETVVNSMLKSTFMDGISILDNQSYASIFVEAGKNASMSAVYLASLAIQESGRNGSKATSGEQFTYNDITYRGLYNFFNIGAFSSEKSPILAGLVWANGANNDNVVNESGGKTEEERSYLETLNTKVVEGCLTNIKNNTNASYFKIGYNDVSITIKDKNGRVLGDDELVGTGMIIEIKDSENTYTYTLSVSGDIDGDGKLSASDYVLIKNNIMKYSNSEFTVEKELAADANSDGKISAADYVLIKNAIMK